MSEATVAGYCRACGKALAEGDLYRAHGAFYCKEHAPAEGASSYTSSPYGASAGSSTNSGGSASYGGPPPVPGVSPVAAFWLGLIPGVGAIYNGQYAKGFVHVAVIAPGHFDHQQRRGRRIRAAGGYDARRLLGVHAV